MIEDKDYIMRLTHEIVRTLIRLLFQKDIDRDEEAAISAEMAVRYRELLGRMEAFFPIFFALDICPQS